MILDELIALAPNAAAGGVAVAAACGAAGVLLRWRRLVWAGLAVPEASMAGVAAALATGLPAALCVPAATGAALIWVVPVARAARRGTDARAAVCLAASTTLAVLLVAPSPHGTEELRALAAGRTLLFLDASDAARLAAAMPCLLAAAWAFAPALAALAFDRDHARAAGRAVAALEAGFAAALFALLALAVPCAGAPFVFAFLVLPAAAAERVAPTPRAAVATSAVLSVVGFLAGAGASVRLDLPFSTACAAGALLVALPFAAVRRKR